MSLYWRYQAHLLAQMLVMLFIYGAPLVAVTYAPLQPWWIWLVVVVSWIVVFEGGKFVLHVIRHTFLTFRAKHAETEEQEFHRLRNKFFKPDEVCTLTLEQLREKI